MRAIALIASISRVIKSSIHLAGMKLAGKFLTHLGLAPHRFVSIRFEEIITLTLLLIPPPPWTISHSFIAQTASLSTTFLQTYPT